MVCSVTDCSVAVLARGLCNRHYTRWYKHGDTSTVLVMQGVHPTVRFWAKVDRRGADECWLWNGPRNSEGYGTFYVDGRVPGAHRYAYEQTIGPIPPGLQLDHLCRNTSCVNPSHLEPVTGRENILRGQGVAARNARKTHCKRGHEFTPENTYIFPNGRWRQCRTCMREVYAPRRKAAL